MAMSNTTPGNGELYPIPTRWRFRYGGKDQTNIYLKEVHKGRSTTTWNKL